jgi:peroxiredoxin (alkyl hydroperoxide reductase subunit C)
MKTRIITILAIAFFATGVYGQETKDYRVPFLGEKAASFTAPSTTGVIDFPSEYYGNWKILFSHPADFTAVCSSEILTLASMQDEFRKLNTAVVVISTDGINSHIAWVKSLETIDYNGLGLQKINFPIVSDVDLVISKKYGMIEANSGRTNNIRGVFIIDPDDKIRAINFYSVSTGRNLEEILRTLIALQTTDKYNILTPANWTPGAEVMIPSPSSIEEAEKLNARRDPSLRQVTWYMWLKTL